MHFELFRAKSGWIGRAQWSWRLRAENGRIIAHSANSFHDRADCLRAIELIRQEATAAPIKRGF